MTDLHAHPILEGDATSAWMGLTVELTEKDHAIVRMTVRDEMVNGFGITHGGMVFAFADSCFALTCNDPDSDGTTITVASGVDVNFMAPTKAGQNLIAEGRLVSRAGRSGVYDITVTTEEGTLVAAFRGRSRTIPNPAAR